MFNSITKFIKETISKGTDEIIDEEKVMHLASTALLLEVSRADFDIQDEELISIVKSLSKRYNFSRDEADNLISLARDEQESHVSIYPFIKIINKECTIEEKKLLLEDLWRVAYADEKIDKYEDYQIRKIADLLYIPHSVFIKTKLKVTKA